MDEEDVRRPSKAVETASTAATALEGHRTKPGTLFRERCYLTKETATDRIGKILEIEKMLGSLMRSIDRSRSR